MLDNFATPPETPEIAAPLALLTKPVVCATAAAVLFNASTDRPAPATRSNGIIPGVVTPNPPVNANVPAPIAPRNRQGFHDSF